jgi:hypothetical protein
VSAPEGLPTEQFARWWNETGERELRQILFWRWDPLRIGGYFPNTVDEYDDYAPGIVALLRLGADAKVLAEHLEFLERGPMGLAAPDSDGRAQTAELLTEWFVTSIDAWTRHGPY